MYFGKYTILYLCYKHYSSQVAWDEEKRICIAQSMLSHKNQITPDNSHVVSPQPSSLKHSRTFPWSFQREQTHSMRKQTPPPVPNRALMRLASQCHLPLRQPPQSSACSIPSSHHRRHRLRYTLRPPIPHGHCRHEKSARHAAA
jgi:hypothetical protein